MAVKGEAKKIFDGCTTSIYQQMDLFEPNLVTNKTFLEFYQQWNADEHY